MHNDTANSAPIQIHLDKDHIAIIDQIDADLSGLKWSAKIQKHSVHAKRLIRIEDGQRSLYLHRVILERMLGRSLVKGEMCDHKDQNGLNCVRSNLRLANMAQNVRNRDKQSNNTAGYKGVVKRKSKWLARIGVNGAKIVLGAFENLEDAARAYNAAALIYHGEFARLNVIEK